MAQATAKSTPSPAALLKLRPNLPGVEYDTPADEATRNACKVEPVVNAAEQEHRIRAARSAREDAAPVRALHAAGSSMDQWSYYQDGFEVYREDDLERRYPPRRVPLAQLGRQPDRPDRERKDHGLEADLGRGGVEGARAGPCRRRRGLARDR